MRGRSARRVALLSLLATSLWTVGLAAQQPTGQTVTTGLEFQGFSLNRGLGIDAASLLIVPVGYAAPIGQRLTVDAYTAYARGYVHRVQGGGATLSGLVDTRVRASWRLIPSGALTVGLNLPTGNATHTSDQAVVAGVMSTNLLGFQESSWGIGAGVTTGLAGAWRVHGWGIGAGGSYRYAGSFRPRTDTAVTYSPGNELRLRVALDRDFGENTLTGGITYQHFAEDKLDRRNLFRSGDRWRFDVSYAFRTGAAATWSAYLADIWRERGDLRLDLVNTAGQLVGDSSLVTGHQNLLIAGLGGSLRLSDAYTVRPSIDFRLQSRDHISAPGGRGWALGAGAALPLRIAGRYDIVPSARLIVGALESADARLLGLWGADLSATVRWRRRGGGS